MIMDDPHAKTAPGIASQVSASNARARSAQSAVPNDAAAFSWGPGGFLFGKPWEPPFMETPMEWLNKIDP